MSANSLGHDPPPAGGGGVAKPRAWKGLLASFILTGAGQFFSGSRKRGVLWLVLSALVSGGLLFIYNLPFVPGKLGIVFAILALALWVAMLIDSWRPIHPMRWWGWALLVVAGVLLSAVGSVGLRQGFHAFRVPTASMSPTVSAGDQILVSRVAYWFNEPMRGDLIAFRTSDIPGIEKDPAGREVIYIKRIVGLPGDRVEILDPGIKINGGEVEFGDQEHPIKYRHGPAYMTLRFKGQRDTYQVPEGNYFVLGDNSRNAFDSRYWGPIPRDAIYGKVTKIYWPWSRMGTPR